MAKKIQTRNQATKAGQTQLDPNELKGVIRDGLANMSMPDREEFIRTLEAEMRKISLNVRAYLIPLGIPGRSPEDLTPSEVGHLVRYLKLTVPRAMPAVERAMARYTVFSSDPEHGNRLAA
ncbi:MAG TPA: hypothetical protein VNS63_12765 [Blastocatellia bacterium]|nr:hypothetical protein [Blastocatellia bacterium]